MIPTRRRAAIHQWIRDDLPLSAKMILTPRHMDALEAKLDSVQAETIPERAASVALIIQQSREADVTATRTAYRILAALGLAAYTEQTAS